jgi:PST family polysaccharide transporter
VFQVFQIAVSFAAMTLMARVIPPIEYGRSTTALGFLVFLNAWSCGVFMAHALQLPAGTEPDWRAHFSAGLYLQGALVFVTVAVALALRASEAHRSLWSLLLVAAGGLVIDWPSQLRQVMLRRALSFRRLRILSMLSLLANVGTTVMGGLLGWGALAIILGGNVATAVPFAAELFAGARFSPGSGWWRWPGRDRYRESLRFGVMQALSTMLITVRALTAATILPGAIGLVAVGLWSRALALYQSSAGRGLSVVVDTVYPLLPRAAGDGERFGRFASVLLRVTLWAIVPLVVVLTLEGSSLSRVLYGAKWTAADPLIAPATLLGALASVGTIATSILLAASRLRLQLLLEVAATLLIGPAMVASLLTRDAGTYAWWSVGGQLVAAMLAVGAAASLLQRGWWRASIVPATIIAVLSVMVLHLLGGQDWWRTLGSTWRLAITSGIVGVTTVGVLRIGFASALSAVLGYLQGGARLRAWLRLPQP